VGYHLSPLRGCAWRPRTIRVIRAKIRWPHGRLYPGQRWAMPIWSYGRPAGASADQATCLGLSSFRFVPFIPSWFRGSTHPGTSI